MESETYHIRSIDSTISECGVIYCMEEFDLSPYIALEDRETILIERYRENTLTHSQSMDEDLLKSITRSSITEVDLHHQQEENLTVPFPWNTLWDESTSVQEDNSSLLDSNPSRSRAYAFIDYSATHILPGLDLSYSQISVTEVIPRKNRNVLNWLKCRLFKM